MFWISALDQTYWAAGSLIGALAGGLLPFDFKGIEFSMTALFLVIFLDQWKNSKKHGAAAGTGPVFTAIAACSCGSHVPWFYKRGAKGGIEGMMKTISIMAIVAFVTLFTRVLPFVLFGGKKGMPKMIGYLGKVLPAAIIAALVVYCFKELTIQPALQKLWSLSAGAAVILLHLWKRNTLVSIAGGTVLYMLLIRI